MAKKRLKTSNKRSRTRSGCLTCRDRHMKCDEQQPVCRNCIKSKRKCYRGIRLNFTHYNIYDPGKNQTSNINYRILDQSITIASLYKNGKKPYEPYVNLHDTGDLEESDFQYQQDTIASFSSSYSTREDAIRFDDRIFIEDNSIMDNLINEKKYLSQYFLPSSSKLSTGNKDTVNIERHIVEQSSSLEGEPNLLDTKQFIELIEVEKYYWILDLFNELNIWRSIVPNFCLKELENCNKSFLLECLLGCSAKSTIDVVRLAAEQQKIWDEVRSNEAHLRDPKNIEILLVSIVLLLLNFEIKFSKSLITLGSFRKNLITDQIKMFDYLSEKIRDSVMRISRSVIIISSIHSITILKFFILKQLESLNFDKIEKTRPDHLVSLAFSPIPNASEDSASFSPKGTAVEHLHEDIPNLDLLLKLNDFEVSNLINFYPSMNFTQVEYGQGFGTDVKSDSLKLREVIWHLIIENNKKQESVKHLRNITYMESSLLDEKAIEDKWVVFPNERSIAIEILSTFTKELSNYKDLDYVHRLNDRIRRIFTIIKSSRVEDEIKLSWISTFGWTLGRLKKENNIE
ncbi:uncharacterized protein PRCAT00002616001 [Priceomyces carsonii]|uniref:uncharacterized protein n=1 Tax=Priceomyces carsonii TaxID=28549 RepID=UPI002ED7FC9B|nr:unnamed protein product [Priceomyces carsonii]